MFLLPDVVRIGLYFVDSYSQVGGSNRTDIASRLLEVLGECYKSNPCLNALSVHRVEEGQLEDSVHWTRCAVGEVLAMIATSCWLY